MKKIIVDLDDVLSIDGYLNMMNDFLHTNYTYEDINDYYVEKIMNEQQLIEYRKFFKEHNVYDYSIPSTNSKEILKKLMLEYEIYVCSSYYCDLDNTLSSELIPKKCEFLKQNYPFLSSKNFIFINDKSILQADIRIDDKIENLTGNGLKLLYTAYHNKDISKKDLISNEIIRVNNWVDIDNEILKVKKIGGMNEY